MLFLYFILLHTYIFSCPFGFTYSALFTLVLFELHLMLFFLNAFEIPAYANGNISALHPRYFYTTNMTTTSASSSASMAASASPFLPPATPTINTTAPQEYAPAQTLRSSIPARNFSALSMTSLNSNDSAPATREVIDDKNQPFSEGELPSDTGKNLCFARNKSFSTPLDEIIAYEQAMKNQPLQHSSSLELSTDMMQSNVTNGMHPSLSRASITSVAGSITTLASRQISVSSDLDTTIEKDVGLALMGSDSVEMMSDGSFSRSNSISDMVQASSSTSELKNVSKALQFQLSKQIQNEQMAAMMAFDLPLPPSQNAPTVDLDHNLIGLNNVEHDNNMNGRGSNVSDIKSTSTQKRSSVLSFLSNFRWGKSKPSLDNTSVSSAATSLLNNDEMSMMREDALCQDVDKDKLEVRTDRSLTEDSSVSSKSDRILVTLQKENQSPTSHGTHKTIMNEMSPTRNCISLSSPLTSEALENLQPNNISRASRSLSELSPPKECMKKDHVDVEDYTREIEGFSIFGVDYDED